MLFLLLLPLLASPSSSSSHAKKPKSMVEANCPHMERYSCECSRTAVTCRNGNLSNTDIFLHFSSLYFPDLDTLTITGNRFRELEKKNIFGPPDANVERLTKLSLASNRIQTMHATGFSKLARLEELDLSDNKISIVNGDLFKRLPNIRKLNLRRALDRSLDDRARTHLLHKLFAETAHELRHLEELDLSGNLLVYISPDLFCRLPALKKLRLQDNILRVFSARDPACLASLTSLDLSNNGISYLGHNFSRLMDTPTHLRAVNLSENPFNCNCYLSPFVEWFQGSDVLVSRESTRCLDARPPSYISSPLGSVPKGSLECPDADNRYLHSVYIVLALASVGLLLLLAGLLHGHRRHLLSCPKGSPFKKGAFSLNKGYRQLGKEAEVPEAEFV